MSDRPLSSGGYRIGLPRRDSNSEVVDAPDIMGISKPADLKITIRGGEINESTLCWHAYRMEDQRKLHSEQDSHAMTAMLDAYLNIASGADYKTAVAQECRKQLESIVKTGEAAKYAVAIKDKDFLWDILYDKIYDHVKRMEVSRD